jgi:hypothetical protein
MGSSRAYGATQIIPKARVRATRAAASAMAGCLVLALGSASVAHAQSAAPTDADASASPGRTQISPSTVTGGLFDAPTQVLVDHFDDDTLWFSGDRATDRFAYQAGTYVVEVKTDEVASWVWRTIGDSHPVLRAEGSVKLSDGRGAGGYMCGAGDGDQRAFIFADVTTSSEWVMGTIAGSTASVRARGPVPSASGMAGAPVVVTLECAMTDAGDRAAMWVDGTAVAEIQLSDVIGPFDKVAAYVGDTTGPFSSTFDDLSVSVGDVRARRAGDPAPGSQPDATPAPSAGPGQSATPRPGPSTAPSPRALLTPDQVSLVAHVPSAFRDTCVSTAELPGLDGQVAGVSCQPAGSADIAWYYQFDSVASMDAGFDSFVPATATGDDCTQGPSKVTYKIGGQQAGRLACYENTGTNGGVQAHWTDEQLRILAFGQESSGSYQDLHDWWLTAGPDR